MQIDSAVRTPLRFVRLRQSIALIMIWVFMAVGITLGFELMWSAPIGDAPLWLGPIIVLLPAIILFPLPWVLAYVGLISTHRLFGVRPFQSVPPLPASLLITVVFYIFGVIGMCGGGIYASRRFASPTPYPGATAEMIWTDRGGGRYTKTFKYKVNTSLDEVQRYYETEMNRYCAAGWKFVETHYYGPDYTKRRTSSCEIPRPLMPNAQSFEVFLLANSDIQTDVLYFETTSDVF